jgi:hypothetical protein
VPETFPDDAGFELLPIEDTDLIDASEQLAAAEASIADDPFGQTAVAPSPIPFGRSWEWDQTTERYVRVGTAPAETRGLDSLRQWIYAALQTAQSVHAVFPTAFGIEDPDDWIGGVDPTDALVTFEPRANDALTQHDRIEELDDVTAEYDPDEGVISIEDLVVITDEQEAVPLTEVELTPNY